MEVGSSSVTTGRETQSAPNETIDGTWTNDGTKIPPSGEGEHWKEEGRKLTCIKSRWKDITNGLGNIRLPFGTARFSGEPHYENTEWALALPETDVRNAQRMLLEAFMIYLARLTYETELHIGWCVPIDIGSEISVESTVSMNSTTVLPMVIRVEFDEPWNSVSKAVDDELLFLTRVGMYASDYNFSDHSIRTSTNAQPWEICVSILLADNQQNHDKSTSKGKLLTLEIDRQGKFRIAFANRMLLDRYLEAVQRLIDPHDILRTAFIWKGLTEPAQIVWRQAPLSVMEITKLTERHATNRKTANQINSAQYHINLERAPLLRYVIAPELEGRWTLNETIHHVIIDNASLEIMHRELQAYLAGKERLLPEPTPFRNLIAAVQFGTSEDAHKKFFAEMLSEVTESTLPFGLAKVYSDGTHVTEHNQLLTSELNNYLRIKAREMNISLATLCHVAFAVVISRTSGRQKVVFGTVLSGRMANNTFVDSTMGLFINTLPIRVDIDETSVEQCVRRTHNRLAQLLEHEHATLAITQQCSNMTNRNSPLFSALLNHRHRFSSSNSSNFLPGIEFLESKQCTNYPVTLSVEDYGSALGLTTQVVEPVCPKRFCAYMQQALGSLIIALDEPSNFPTRSIEMLPIDEYDVLLRTKNSVQTNHTDLPCIQQLFEQQVCQTPDATAVVYRQQTLSYAELNTRANRLAHQLIDLGLSPEQRVVICLPRGPELVIGILAVLKAGGTYVPIDPIYPSERSSYILSDAGPRIVLADKVGSAALGDISLARSIVIDPHSKFDFPETNPMIPQLDSRNTAYVIYTSGSTGRPKGVLVEHRNVVRLFATTESKFGFNRRDTWCLFHSFAFDVSVWELWGALNYGGRLLIVANDVSRAPQELEQIIREHSITVLNLTPSAFGVLMGNYFTSSLPDKLRYIIFAGERLEPSILRSRYAMRQHESPRLVNMYGTTETTVHATYRALTEYDANSMVSPIGERLPDSRLYLLDVHGQPVPLGAVGEIYIGGAGTTRGYLNRPDLTADRFIEDPFADALDARMYRTGDLAYYSTDGTLVYVGRNDLQVKLRGFRIEPREIEACLRTYPTVSEALVVLLSDELDERLVAYVIANAMKNIAPLLREYALTRLPEYMVPSAFILLDAFPLTPNGKIDTAALPLPDRKDIACQILDAPRGAVETALANIWSKFLRLEQVSRQDSFFTLGGHSLIAVRVIEHMRILGWNLGVRELFEHPVLSDLANVVKQHKDLVIPTNVITPATTKLTPDMLPLIDLTQTDIDEIVSKVPGGIANIQDIYALSPLQNGILFHNMLDDEEDPYSVTSRIAFADRMLLDRYLGAVQRVIDRHDILRTAFIWKGLTEPAQVVWRQAPILITELTKESETRLSLDGSTCQVVPQQYRIHLERAPLLRYIIVPEDSGRWIVTQMTHHVVIDQTTLEIMHSELRAYLTEKESSLPMPSPFRNLIASVRLNNIDEDARKEFFVDMLHGVDESTLPFGLAMVYNNGTRAAEYNEMLSFDMNDRLRIRAKQMNVSLATLCHVAYGVVISKTSGRKNVVFGTVLSGRIVTHTSMDSTMGLFINTLPLRVDIDESSVEQCLRGTHNRLAHLLELEHASLAIAQRCSNMIDDRAPLFSALLNYRHNLLSSKSSVFMPGIEFLDSKQRTNYPVALAVEDYGSALGLTTQVVEPACPKRFYSYMQQALGSLIDALEQPSKVSTWSIEILPPDERLELLETRNHIQTEPMDYPCIHQLFEHQVLQTPDATAVVYMQQTLSYAELNIRANRIAHRLIDLGLLPEQRVVICVARGPAVVIGILAVLKAGGAYVPIDPSYSSERSSYILRDAAPKIVLADEIGRAALGKGFLTESTIIDPGTRFDLPDANPMIAALSSRHVAYVIYTSGSTGTPKGVIVEHSNIVRLFTTTESKFNFDRHDTWCLFHSFAFDFSVWELWGALIYGGQLVIVSNNAFRSPHAMQKLICEHGVTVLNLTPSAFQAIMTDQYNTCSWNELRYIIFGGERLDPSTLQSWYAVHEYESVQLVNMYGPTETTAASTYLALAKSDASKIVSSIGKRLPDSRLYLLDVHGQPVPLGAVGEICIGGRGVARGYLKRSDLTSKRFLADSFSDAFDARMYRTGDMGYYLADGTVAYVGRNDQQVKIRGFRIEPREVEACLRTYPTISEALVVVRGEQDEQRLVAYVIGDFIENIASVLREYALTRLPEYMVPLAFILLDAFPLTVNGKLDTAALPSPDRKDIACQFLDAPQGAVETALANIWSKLLHLEQVSRHDSFFALGGHSLIAARVIEHMRILGWNLGARELFEHPVLSDLANFVEQHKDLVIPMNVITPATTKLTPDMLPLIDLTQTDIDEIVSKVPGGIANIQDIYALSPLQNGILFHNMFDDEEDPYSVTSRIAFADRMLLDRYLEAVQRVIDRHDILRTAFIWKGLTEPAQVVWRQAPILITELTKESETRLSLDGSTCQVVPQQYRIHLERAPLLRYVIVPEDPGRWIVTEMTHHVVSDHTTLEIMHSELRAYLTGEESSLPIPSPFRNLIASVRLNNIDEDARNFFVDMLREVDESTLPFGLTKVYNNGTKAAEYNEMLSFDLNDRLRIRAKQMNVSLATLCHVAYGVVISKTSSRKNVVFGTVLSGRMVTHTSMDSTMGLFINTLPLRVDIDESSVEQCLRATHNRLTRLLGLEHASLAVAQRCSNMIDDRAPLFSALLNYRHNLMSSDLRVFMPGIEFLHSEERTNYAVALSVEDYGSSLGLTTQVVEPVCPKRFYSYMQQALTSLIDALEQPSEVSTWSIEILPPDERLELLETRNHIQTEPMDYPCIHQLFEHQVLQTPDAIAVVYMQQSLSYVELNIRANRLARRLIDLGLLPEQRVVICVARGPAVVIGILAVLKAGGAYVPIDPSYSSERSSYILRDAAPKIVLADEIGRAALGEGSLTESTIIDPGTRFDLPDANPMIAALSSRHVAYVIYTSGSTGTPKGVIVEHSNIVRLFTTTESKFNFDKHDTWCLFHSFAFDFSVWELWGALIYGGQLVIVSNNAFRSPHAMQKLICEHGVTVLNLTPSAFQALLADQCTNCSWNELRYIIFGGERLDPSTLQSWYAVREYESVQLVNMYGTTETSVTSTYSTLTKSDVRKIVSLIGERLPDSRLYLLDVHGQPVPLGVVGEICIGGRGVARGYLKRSDLTSERFLADSFSDSFDARMYRTGDMGYYLADGTVAYVGRNDQQVKIRGFRIEPREVEACLRTYPTISEALVVVRGEQDEQRLVTYVIGDSMENMASVLREYALTRLPEYMVPSAFILLDAFPLTVNGKLDTAALPPPDRKDIACQVLDTPQGAVETALANIWRKLLHVEQVSRHDSFFALGGHSLIAVRVIEHMRILGWNLGARELFEHPVLSDLANVVEQHKDLVIPMNVITSATSKLTPDMLPLIDLTQTDIDEIVSKVPGGIVNIQDIYALSPLQKGILFHGLLDTHNDPYILTSRIAFANRNLLNRYLEAVQRVIDRHDILRTAFLWEGLKEPAQVVWRQAPLSVMETTETRSIPSFSEHRIRFEQAPLLCYVITCDESGHWILTQTIHHVIVDHTTLEIMNKELLAHLTGHGNSLSQPSPFRNLIANVRFGISQDAHEKFFTDMLSEVYESALPFGLTEVHSNGPNVTDHNMTLTSRLNDRLRTQARKMKVGLASLCHVAYAVVMSRTSGQQNVVFGTVLSGRMTTNISADSTMGLFINTLPLRVDVSETAVEQCLKETHNRLAQLLAHEHASLAVAQRCSRVHDTNSPLFSALLNYRQSLPSSAAGHLLPGIEFLEIKGCTNYPVILSVQDYGSVLGLSSQVVAQVCPKRFCAYMEQALESLSNALDQPSKIPTGSIEIMPLTERHELLKMKNECRTEHTDLPCVHQLFEQQVSETPDATAVVYMQRILTYAELNARANRLAHQLIDLGLLPEQRVVICVARGSAIVIAILAVLKAGGAYVPIDPTYSSERSSYIFNDAAPSIALVDKAGRAALHDEVLEGLPVLDPNVTSHFPQTNPHVLELCSRHLAYVIYTSGSTGTPKGVLVEHRNVIRLFTATDTWFGFNQEDTWCLFHSFAFDFSVWELWGPLIHGGKLIIVANTICRSPQEMQQLIRSHGVTVLNLTPSAFKVFIVNYYDTSLPDKLRYIILGGERFDPSMLRSWYAVRDYKLPQLVNMYGTTETTVHATYKALAPCDTDSTIHSPIGKRLPDSQLYLLDPNGLPVPYGVTGEIHIGGPGVARGYLNRSDFTSQRFLTDSCSDAIDARMYRTGDMGYYLADGTIAYVGRNDQQVKIRGFRIELCEVEACLIAHPAVNQAVVTVINEDYSDRLVAYILADSVDNVTVALREHASAHLPEYMIPSAFVKIDAFPLTSNGKLDIDALPAPGPQDFARRDFEVPRGNTENVIAVTWSELLDVDRVGRYDCFFSLGGHSLLAIRMISYLADRGISCTLNDLFQFPILADLASKITRDMINPPRSTAKCIRSSGTEAPLFFLPSGIGDFSYAFALAVHIKSNCPIWALPWPDFHRSSISSVEDLATKMVGLIKTVHTRGPYRLCGYSSGGILAYCVAQLLLNAGESVDFLGMIDTCVPLHIENSVSSDNYLCFTELILTSGSSKNQALESLYHKIEELDFEDFIEFAHTLKLYPPNVSVAVLVKRFEQRRVYTRMIQNYIPPRINTTVHIFYATEDLPELPFETNSEEPPANNDPTRSWIRVVPESCLRLIPIPGHHVSMIEDNENRLALGKAISTMLYSA